MLAPGLQDAAHYAGNGLITYAPRAGFLEEAGAEDLTRNGRNYPECVMRNDIIRRNLKRFFFLLLAVPMIVRQDGEPHVLHELAEQLRTLVDKKGNKQVFDCHLHREAIRLTNNTDPFSVAKQH